EFVKRGDDALLADDARSAASGRTLEEIAAGKGRGPKPFMTSGGKVGRADAVWNSNATPDPAAGGVAARINARLAAKVGRMPRPESAPAKRRSNEAMKRGRNEGGHRAARAGASARGAQASMPKFIEPVLCRLLPRPPEEAGWAHEIKLDGYRLQLRVEQGRAVLLTRKGLDWTERFASIARAAGALPDCIIDGEAVALNRQGVSDFSALQAALSEGHESAPILFAFDLMFLEGRDLRSLPLDQRKEELEKLLKSLPASSRARLRYLGHFT